MYDNYSFIFNHSLHYPSDDISFGGSLEDECSWSVSSSSTITIEVIGLENICVDDWILLELLEEESGNLLSVVFSRKCALLLASVEVACAIGFEQDASVLLVEVEISSSNAFWAKFWSVWALSLAEGEVSCSFSPKSQYVIIFPLP